MLDIEDTLRTAVAHTLGETYTANQSLYLKPSNFRLGRKRKNGKYQLEELLSKFEKILEDNVQPMKHYRETYKNIPPWILLKGASFGNLVNFVKLQKDPQFNPLLHNLLKISEADYRVGKGKSGLITLTSALYFLDNKSSHNRLKNAMCKYSKEHCNIYPNDTDYLKEYVLVE